MVLPPRQLYSATIVNNTSNKVKVSVLYESIGNRRVTEKKEVAPGAQTTFPKKTFHEGPTEYVYYIQDVKVSGGSLLSIGLEFLNERQDLKITNYDTITSGTFNINYQYLVGGDMIVVANLAINYDSNFTTMANEIQNSLRSVVNLEDVTVSVSNDASSKEVAFQIEFVGSAGYRYHDLMSVTDISLYGLSGSIAITRTVAGSPINRIADEIENNLVNPAGITFVNYTGFSPAEVGDFRPLDFFAVWIKRVCPAGVDPIEADGGVIRVSGGII